MVQVFIFSCKEVLARSVLFLVRVRLEASRSRPKKREGCDLVNKNHGSCSGKVHNLSFTNTHPWTDDEFSRTDSTSTELTYALDQVVWKTTAKSLLPGLDYRLF